MILLDITPELKTGPPVTGNGALIKNMQIYSSDSGLLNYNIHLVPNSLIDVNGD